MKPAKFSFLISLSILAFGCASVPPNELVSAREAYRRASNGPAGHISPAEVHVANLALAEAEQSFKKDPDSYRTLDLSYVAERKAQLAEAIASTVDKREDIDDAEVQFATTQNEIVEDTKDNLARSEQNLARSEVALETSRVSGAHTAEQLAAEKVAREAADQRAATAQAALAKLAAIKEEPRGMVITLSGSVLFASNQAVLLPAARDRLNQVADVLMATRERNVLVEGYTDSRGTDSYNIDLSQRRADAVRSYLVSLQYDADLIRAQGMGEASPIADNQSAEGRANNRRVEIVIERDRRGAAGISSR